MHTVKVITNVISSKAKNEILELVRNNAHEIGGNVIQKKSPYYEYVKTLEETRTSIYLERLESPGLDQTFLIVAEDEGEIIGYLLYNRDIDCFDDVSVCSIIVAEEYRGKGIFISMIDSLKSQSKSIGLSCSIDKVAFYQNRGFKIYQQHDTQVGMCYGTFIGEGRFYSVDDEYLESQPLVVTQKRMVETSRKNAFKKLAEANLQEQKKVEKFVQGNKQGYPTLEVRYSLIFMNKRLY
ncbi:GNAT family N-acetyltransferase [Enterococcus faecalis]|uniref:GNAT family N-acetyltransferase n=1 Tax=Enterococcus faecalis TaxID=1351 RepID=UPI002FDBB4AF